jgi:hypothetical protein
MFGGSPGSSRPDRDQDIVFTEVLTHSPAPAGDKIELHNRGNTAAEIGGWLLSNSDEDYFQYQIPANTNIAAGGYYVLDQTEFGLDLSASRGAELWLLEADQTGRPVRFADHLRVGPAGLGITMGPGPDNDHGWLPLAAPTWGRPNSGLLVGDVLISEVHYAPRDPDGERRQLEADDFEFVELFNRTQSRQDVSGWRLTGGPQFTLPEQTEIAPHQSILVVPFDPADQTKAAMLRVLYGVDSSVALVGPLSDPLGDERDVVRLERPDSSPPEDPTLTPYLYVDELAYRATAPWPVDIAGTDRSLTRISLAGYGNWPATWAARHVSPGTVDLVLRPAGDANADGRFDQLDLQQVIQAGKYLTGQPASHDEGDWNRDGLFDQLDIIAALRTDTYTTAPTLASQSAARLAPLRDAGAWRPDDLFAQWRDELHIVDHTAWPTTGE